ncbi:nuclear transport factor 2 family protein [Haliea sp. E17]|uniref:nuclear transport factor 2 family protein n=1 Tax=Haliea sp. E17 TaxID=3401576 RepID=UPI003AAC2313
MRHRFFPATLLLLAALFANAAKADATAAVNQVLDRFHAAAAMADRAGYFSLMTEDMVFLGTDGSERWAGQDWRDFVTENFDRGRGWTYTAQTRNVTVSADGKTAWFDESLEHAELGPCRGSGVLVLGNSGWQLAQYNLSVPIPNAMVDAVAEAIRNDASSFAPPPATGDATAGDSAPAASDEPEAPESAEKRCPIRHKTVRAAQC